MEDRNGQMPLHEVLSRRGFEAVDLRSSVRVRANPSKALWKSQTDDLC